MTYFTDSALAANIIIASIRIGIKNSAHRFTNGGCFQLYRILKNIYPDAEAWYLQGHVYTKIGEAYYDINGSRETLEGGVNLQDEPMLFAKAHEWDFV